MTMGSEEGVLELPKTHTAYRRGRCSPAATEALIDLEAGQLVILIS